MTRDVSRFLAPDFLSLTIGIVVYFVGVLTTQRVKFLRNFSIPEPVSGGFIAGAVVSLVYLVFNLDSDAAGGDIYGARGLSCTWKGLSGCGAERWVYQHIARLDACPSSNALRQFATLLSGGSISSVRLS